MTGGEGSVQYTAKAHARKHMSGAGNVFDFVVDCHGGRESGVDVKSRLGAVTGKGNCAACRRQSASVTASESWCTGECPPDPV
mmetsp:Transcript_45800/g.108629  ORF Transcript_45800/g.108629 Transcript_45800/m.108629 type:complete len:83 (-) Transcript_45800:49-297(-)